MKNNKFDQLVAFFKTWTSSSYTSPVEIKKFKTQVTRFANETNQTRDAVMASIRTAASK